MISHFAAAAGRAGMTLSVPAASEPRDSDALANVRRVLIVNSDRLYSDLLRRSVQSLVTTAKVLIACTLADASAALAQQPVDILVTSVLAEDGEVLSALPDWVERRQVVRDALVVTSRKEPWVLEQLAQAPIRGVCDAQADIDEFSRALVAVADGGQYWTSTVRAALDRGRSVLSRVDLTPTERLVLAVIGAGADDTLAADELQMAPSTVASVRKQLHRKLGVQHRGALMQRAHEYGVVIINSGRVIRPGFSALWGERSASRRAKPAA